MRVISRREFIGASSKLALCLAGSPAMSRAATFRGGKPRIPVCAHLWVYASKFPGPISVSNVTGEQLPPGALSRYDCSSILEDVFSDLHYAGMDGVEVMDVNLRHEDAVERIQPLIKKYNLPVSGSSYSAALWNRSAHPAILADVRIVVGRLHELGGKTLGISVGNAGHVKTPEELDSQASILEKFMKVCAEHSVVPNLHNHTYEVANNLHDLRGTLSRIPEIKLGPDLAWLIRAGVDPVEFIHEYGKNIVYLHIRDQRADGQWTEAVGEGTTNFKVIATALQEAHFKGSAAIELAFPDQFTPVRPLKEDWKISREFVRTTFGW